MSASIRYDLVTRVRAGHEHTREYVSERPLGEGDVIVFRGDRWIIDRVEEQAGSNGPPRAFAEPARYRLILLHEDGSEEAGAVRRLRSEVPGLGHAFTTLDGRKPISWEVTDERLVRDERGRPLIEFVAERDYGEEAGELPNHELEHLGAGAELPDVAAGVLARASANDMHTELVALDAGAAPDWDEAERYLDALVLEELGDDLLELCGVAVARDPRDTWLARAQARLRRDLELFRADVEGDHDEIEEWESGGARIFASVGAWEDEAAPDKGHGWMCRLVDAGVLGAAGLRRVRRVEL